MDRGAWQATVSRLAKSRTWLKWLSIRGYTEFNTCGEEGKDAGIGRGRRRAVINSFKFYFYRFLKVTFYCALSKVLSTTHRDLYSSNGLSMLIWIRSSGLRLCTLSLNNHRCKLPMTLGKTSAKSLLLCKVRYCSFRRFVQAF